MWGEQERMFQANETTCGKTLQQKGTFAKAWLEVVTGDKDGDMEWDRP